MVNQNKKNILKSFTMKIITIIKKINLPTNPKISVLKRYKCIVIITIAFLYSISNYGQEVSELKKYMDQS